MNERMEEDKDRRSVSWLVVLSTTIVIAAVLLGLWYWGIFSPKRTYTHEQTPFRVLMSTNQAFTEAEALLDARQFEQAIEKYKESLAFAEDRVQAAQIRYRIALSHEIAGEYVEALKLYKELAVDARVYRFVHAYAVERIGRMYYTYSDASDVLFTETFKDEPFKRFAENADPDLAYRRLFEYGSSFYPLGMSQARIANWYAIEALRLKRASSSPEVVEEYLGKVRQGLTNVDADIGRIKGLENEEVLIPGILSRKGEVLLRLAWMGEADPSEAEAAYTQAVQLADVMGGGKMGFARFYLASFLERYYGEERANDVRAALEPLYRDWPEYADTPLPSLFRSQRTTDTWMHKSLANMGNIDPEFKKILLSLGWTEDNFK